VSGKVVSRTQSVLRDPNGDNPCNSSYCEIEPESNSTVGYLHLRSVHRSTVSYLRSDVLLYSYPSMLS